MLDERAQEEREYTIEFSSRLMEDLMGCQNTSKYLVEIMVALE